MGGCEEAEGQRVKTLGNTNIWNMYVDENRRYVDWCSSTFKNI